MNKFINLLFEIDAKLEHLSIHIILLTLLIYGLFHSLWIQMGFICYCILWIMFAEKNWGKPLKSHNFKLLGLLKGLNYSLLFGPLGLIVHFLLKK